MKNESVKAKVEFLYDYDCHFARKTMARLLDADKAWHALSNIEEICRKFRKYEEYEDKVDKLLTEIFDEIAESQLEEHWS